MLSREIPGQAEEVGRMNFISFNKEKFKVLHLDTSRLQYQHRLGDEWVRSSPVEKDLGTLMDEKQVVS